ncbi:reverse transcriptase domain-containing protein [Sorangium sp. So ce1014]
MTMEEVASEDNLMRAFEKVPQNDGAPGPDRQSVDEVRAHLGSVLPVLRRELLDGSYRPGLIRRVWIPKAGGGQRGLGIPKVVDRIVQQAVHLVLSPHYEPTFHKSSHGFRPGRSCHTAIADAVRHLEEGHEWRVDLGPRSQERGRATGGATRRRLQPAARAGGWERRGGAVEAVQDPRRRKGPRAGAAQLGKVAPRLHPPAQRVPARLDRLLLDLHRGRGADAIEPRRAHPGRAHPAAPARAAAQAVEAQAHDRTPAHPARREAQAKTVWKVYEGHRSWWALSHSSPVGRGLRNAYFAERGLVSLAAKWREQQGRAIIAPAQLALPLG